MTLPRRTFGCSREVLSTLSIFIATKSPILNLLTLPLDSFIFLLYFCCCPVMYSSVAFLLYGFSGDVPGWSAAENPIVLFPEPFGLLVDSDISLNSVTVPEFVSSSHSSTWSWTWLFLCRGISFQGSIPNTTSYSTLFITLCNEMFFLYAASLRTLHHLFQFWSRSLSMLVMFSLTVKLFRSTRPCVVGVLGAPKTCLMLCFSHISVIVLLLNSLPLSEWSFEGKPNIQNNFISLFTLHRKQPWIFTEVVYHMGYPVMFGITFTWKIAKVNEVYLHMFQKFSCCYWICYCLLGVVCHTFLLLV